MKLLVVCYSLTGNNHRLAHRLAQRLGADLIEVEEIRRRRKFDILLDLVFRRRPRIRDIRVAPYAFDHILFVAPLWDRRLAHPMASAVRQLAGRPGPYSFVTLCGQARPQQTEQVTAELASLAGRAPDGVTELHVASLLSGAGAEGGLAASSHRVTEAELDRFRPQIDAIVGRFAADAQAD